MRLLGAGEPEVGGFVSIPAMRKVFLEAPEAEPGREVGVARSGASSTLECWLRRERDPSFRRALSRRARTRLGGSGVPDRWAFVFNACRRNGWSLRPAIPRRCIQLIDKLGRVFGRYVIALVAALSLLRISGAAAAYSAPSSSSRSRPQTAVRTASAAGLDGNVWFTEEAGGKIGRIEPSGKITEFPVPGGNLRNIAMGPHGNLWFTAAWGIGQITPNGVVDDLPPAEQHAPGGDGRPGSEGLGRRQGGVDRPVLDGRGSSLDQFPFPGTCCDRVGGEHHGRA